MLLNAPHLKASPEWVRIVICPDSTPRGPKEFGRKKQGACMARGCQAAILRWFAVTLGNHMPADSIVAISQRDALLPLDPTIHAPIPRMFSVLWLGQSISIIGSQLSAFTIQVIAVTTLGANAMQMGFLTACQTVPYLFLSLFVGVMIDRIPKRQLLIIADIVRALTMIAATLRFALGRLTILELCCVVCFISVFNLVFDASLGALIPELFSRSQRLSVNSRLNVSASGGEVVGPTLGGIALQFLRAGGAMLFDAATYLMSAVCIWICIPSSGPRAADGSDEGARVAPLRIVKLIEAICEGLSFVIKHPLLRAFAVWSAVWNFCWSAVLAVLVIQATRNLNLAPAEIGLSFAATGIGGIVGSCAGAWLGRHWRQRLVLVLAPLVGAAGGAVLLLSHPIHPFATVAFALFIYGVGESCFGVNMQTCRQDVTPVQLMGRMDTTMRFCFKGMASLGAISGGLIGSTWGIRAAITFGVSGLIVTVGGLALSVLRGDAAAFVENSPRKRSL